LDTREPADRCISNALHQHRSCCHCARSVDSLSEENLQVGNLTIMFSVEHSPPWRRKSAHLTQISTSFKQCMPTSTVTVESQCWQTATAHALPLQPVLCGCEPQAAGEWLGQPGRRRLCGWHAINQTVVLRGRSKVAGEAVQMGRGCLTPRRRPTCWWCTSRRRCGAPRCGTCTACTPSRPARPPPSSRGRRWGPCG